MIFENISNLPSINQTPKPRVYISKTMHSHLMVRADNPKHLNKLNELKCDIATINLEDGISKEDKPKALNLTKIFLSHLEHSYSKVVIRVNEIENGGFEEIKELEFLNPYAFRVPKLRSIDELEMVKELTSSKVFATIETKEAFRELDMLLASSYIDVAYFGVLDLLADLHLPQSMVKTDNETIKYLMSEFVIKCRTHSVLPISFTYQEYKNEDRFREWCEISKRVGFAGQSCIAPNQVEIANSVFKQSSMEIEKAKEIKELFETNKEKGITGFSHGKYGFIDEPIYRDALTILEK
ncbi:MAG: HpcH/HpaI aldolase/citrate lyase family protein [Campylobacterales bacterium]